jgi:hypothetical protein
MLLKEAAQHALPADAASLRFAAQLKRGSLGGLTATGEREE